MIKQYCFRACLAVVLSSVGLTSAQNWSPGKTREMQSVACSASGDNNWRKGGAPNGLADRFDFLDEKGGRHSAKFDLRGHLAELRSPEGSMHLVENKLTGQHEVWSGKGELIPVKRSKIPRERMQVLANQLNKSLIQSLQCRSSVARLPRPSFAGVPLTKNTNWQLNAKATKINLDSDQQELDFPEEYADAGFWEAYLTEEYVDPWILAEFQQNKSPCQLAIESCENTCLGVGVIGGLLGAGMIFGTRSWAGTVVGAAILLGTAWGYDKCRSNCVPERLPGCK